MGQAAVTLGCSLLTAPPCPPELTVADRRQKREIRQLEQELHKWQVLVDSITGERRRWLCPMPCFLGPMACARHLPLLTLLYPRHELSGL